MRQLPNTDVRSEYIGFIGGLDTTTPPLAIAPGFVREAQNFEQDLNGGYRRFSGYERFDGRPKPSDAHFYSLECTITGTVSLGDVLTDDATTSYGTVIALPTGYAILTKLTGHFSAGNIKVGGTIVGTCTGREIMDSTSSPSLAAQYMNLAADKYRADIAAVPGEGDIRGVWHHNDVIYAVRNASGGLTAELYKSTVGGWASVPLGFELSFTDGGPYQVQEGDVITGATSTETATITRVVLESGSWQSGTAAGRFIFASKSGTFQAENLNVGAELDVATIGGDATAITLLPSGTYKTVTANFGGTLGTLRVYGCDGVNRGFEFDGTVFVPISTGMSPDTPHLVAYHKNHLFFAFGSSVQHSATAEPYVWSVIMGAQELAMGDTITGFQIQTGSQSEAAMAIFTRNSIAILYGTSAADWMLNHYKEGAGAIAGSVQNPGLTVMLDDRGITTLLAAQDYGNFLDAVISQRIKTWLTERKNQATVTCSTINREKSQYRLFFSDKRALFVTFDNKEPVGMLPMLFEHEIDCVCNGEMLDGSEATFFGSADGYVYEMDKGTSFDGEPIEAFLTLAYHNSKSPRVRKRYRRASFEVQGQGYAQFNFSYELGYTTTEIDQPVSETMATSFSAAYWDSFTWDAFFWDGSTLLPTVLDLVGTAENISMKIRSLSDYYYPITLSGVILEYTPRRRMR